MTSQHRITVQLTITSLFDIITSKITITPSTQIVTLKLQLQNCMKSRETKGNQNVIKSLLFCLRSFSKKLFKISLTGNTRNL